ncbi:MAG TPA: hypothetical protein VN516_07565, partial [Candidatus Baltobacteraceae bacterium]|nr:hypothetical protein [Candidatus Baltobacteraceae bacterium]
MGLAELVPPNRMKIFNSIKWRLQIWYGLILVAVLVWFGFTAYVLEYGRRMQRVDDDLHRRFKILTDALHDSQPPFQNRPRPGRPPGQPSANLSPEQNSRIEKFELPQWAIGLFDTNRFYFIIFHDGKEIAHGGEVPSQYSFEPMDNGLVKANYNRGPQSLNPKPPPALTESNFRVVYDMTPSGESIT